MSNIPKSYFEIDGLRIEAESKIVLTYVLAIRRALVELRERGDYDTWVGVTGTVDAILDGHPPESARHSQVVRLRVDSSVNYQIIEDEFSAKLFDEGEIGQAGEAFLGEFFDSDKPETSDTE